MRILHRYIFANLLSTFVMALLVLSFVMMVGLLFKATGYIASGASLANVLRFLGLGFPGTLSLSIPIGALVSTMLVFGRLSADSEISAMRACGVSMRRIMLTPFLLGIALSAVCFYITGVVAPNSAYARRTIRRIVKTTDVLAVLEPGKSIAGIPGMPPDTSVFVRERDGDLLLDVRIQEPLKSGIIRDIKAREARVVQQTNGTVRLEMRDVTMVPFSERIPTAGWTESLDRIIGDALPDPEKLPERRVKDLVSTALERRTRRIRERLDESYQKLSENRQNLQEYADESSDASNALGRAIADCDSLLALDPGLADFAFSLTNAETAVVDPETKTFVLPPLRPEEGDSVSNRFLVAFQDRLDFERKTANLARARGNLLRRDQMLVDSIRSDREEISKMRTEAANRIVLALASLCLIAVAVPYGLKSSRRESSTGTAICIGVCAFYNLVLITTESLAKHAALFPHLLAWIPVALCAALSLHGIRNNT